MNKKEYNYFYKKDGFTYVELLIVVGIMIIFGVFFVMAVDPVGKIKAQRDSQRESDINSVLLSVEQKIRNDRGWNCPFGPLPQDKFTAIGTGPGEYDLYSCLMPNYLSKYLVDPKEGSITGRNITDGLVGHWKFDEGSGTIAYDASGNDNHGTLVNGPNWVDGKIGGALEFDGDNDYIDLGDVKIPSNLTEVSLGAWVKTPISSGHHRVFSKEGVLYVGIYGENISFYSGSGSNWIDIWTGGNFGTISENEWTHITWVKNGTTYKAYKNGNLTGTETGSLDTLGDNTENDVFGQVLPGSTTQSWEGLIDDVRIYNRALSPEEIQDLYNYEYSSKYAIWQNPVTKNISLKSINSETRVVMVGEKFYFSCLDLLENNPSVNLGDDGFYDINVGLENIEVYCDMSNDEGGWTLINEQLLDNIQINEESSSYTMTTGINNGISIKIESIPVNANGCSPYTPAAVVLITDKINWSKIRYTQEFRGSNSCWMIFSNDAYYGATNLPKANVYDFDQNIDIIKNQLRMGGVNGDNWDYRRKRCDNEPENFWHHYNYWTGVKQATVIMRRKNINQPAGMATGTTCVYNPSWTWKDIWIR